MVSAQTRICPRKWDALNSLGFWDENGFPDPDQETRLRDNKQKKRTCCINDFAVPAHHRVKINECEKKRQVIRRCLRAKKAVEHESDSDTNCDWHTWNDPQRVRKRAGWVGNWRTNQDNPDYSVV